MTTLIWRTAAAASLLFSLTAGAAQFEGFTPARVLPGDFKWVSTPTGLQVATIAGNQGKPGLYTARVKYPAGFRLQPHFHPDDRVVIVLSGTVYFGYGDQFDESKLTALPTGSVWTEPAKTPHYLWTKHGEAVIQGIGESIRPPSVRGLPACRNSVCERDPDRAHAHYVNLAPLPTPGRRSW